MPPDVAWADGSFACLRAALEAGKRALFMTYPRVVSEIDRAGDGRALSAQR